jgi:hypothetical protein
LERYQFYLSWWGPEGTLYFVKWKFRRRGMKIYLDKYVLRGFRSLVLLWPYCIGPTEIPGSVLKDRVKFVADQLVWGEDPQRCFIVMKCLIEISTRRFQTARLCVIAQSVVFPVWHVQIFASVPADRNLAKPFGFFQWENLLSFFTKMARGK